MDQLYAGELVIILETQHAHRNLPWLLALHRYRGPFPQLDQQELIMRNYIIRYRDGIGRWNSTRIIACDIFEARQIAENRGLDWRFINHEKVV